MTNILGYDIEGRPLRAGDEVVLLWVNDPETVVNRPVTVTGAEHCCGYQLVQYDGFYLVVGQQLRKLRGDHKPASESFQDIMRKYGSKQGVSV